MTRLVRRCTQEMTMWTPRASRVSCNTRMGDTSPGRPAWPLSLAAVVLGAALLAGCGSNRGPVFPAQGANPNNITDSSHSPSPNRERAGIRLTLASTYFQNEQYEVALEETNHALDLDNTFVDAYSLRGLIYTKLDEPAKAEASFRRALQIRPDDSDARHNLGMLYCQNKQLAAAVRELTQAAADARTRNRGKTLLAMGVCQLQLGDAAGAEATLQRAFANDPGDPMISYNLAKLQYQRGAFAEAQQSIRVLNNSQYANAESMWLGIRAARKAGDGRTMRDLGEQLRRRFASSTEYQKYQQGAFDE